MAIGRRRRPTFSLATRQAPPATRDAFTLVEMLIAMALTLILMAAVVSVFANVSKSVANRRSAVEMTGKIRNARNLLQRDLAGATCPGVPWQRPSSNHGYIEIIEGPRCDFDPSIYLQDANNNQQLDWPEEGNLSLDLTVSTIPSSNLATLPGKPVSVATRVTQEFPGAVTDGGGLGDWDDILMLTVRNEDEPFTGNVPAASVQGTAVGNTSDFFNWGTEQTSSTLAEVAWFSVENPVEATGSESFAFGEPGLRTVYRRVLLIAPWLNFSFQVDGPNGTQVTGPGVLRVLGGNLAPPGGPAEDGLVKALAALVAFQDRYDISARVEWDPLLGTGGRWKLVANSLADLTKREHRFEHHGFSVSAAQRRFPYNAASQGAYSNGRDVWYAADPETPGLPGQPAQVPGFSAGVNGGVATFYFNDNGARPTDPDRINFPARPFLFFTGAEVGQQAATPRAILNQSGNVVHVTLGLAPLGGARYGEDIILQDALAFDLRVYDPKAPVVAEITSSLDPNFPGSSLTPGDSGWGAVVQRDGATSTVLSRGAYVDLGYYRLHQGFYGANSAIGNWPNLTVAQAAHLVDKSILADRPALKSQMRPFFPNQTEVFDPYRTYDTWSLHYENNGVNEDLQVDNGLVVVDEGANGFDDAETYPTSIPDPANPGSQIFFYSAHGPDDRSERETSPPYDTRLRGVQVIVRGYEADSRQFREVKVHQSYVPK